MSKKVKSSTDQQKSFVKNLTGLTKVDNDPLSKSIRYYSAKFAQKWALLTLVGATILYWIFLISTASNVYFLEQSGQQVVDANKVNADIQGAENIMQSFVVRWSVFFLLGTVALLLVKRVRKYEKPQLVENLIIAIFCLGSVAISDSILQYFLSNYLQK